MASTRSRPFNLTFHPCGVDEDPGQYKTRTIPINSAPVEIENAHFKGSVILIHDTGNEPGVDPSTKDAGERRGLEMQMQGKFKKSVEKGADQTHGLWVGGELPEVLKLGWIMQNVVQLCMKYARKKTEGRLFYTLGNKEQNPHLSFPIGQLFTCISTPPGTTPPQLGSQELRDKKWPGPESIDITSDNTYTLLYKTPYLDLCSWELLKVPGVSPLPIESILGDLSTTHIFMYDLGAVSGSHPDCKKACLLEWVFTRGAAGDAWDVTEEDEEIHSPPLSSGAKTPLAADDDDASEASEQVSEADVEDALIAVDDQQDGAGSSSDSSESIGESEEEDEQMSRADSQALFEIEGWRPREEVGENVETRVPYYIEAIDRRRKRKVRIWYVISLVNHDGGDEWWHAKDAYELASHCRPRRRLAHFRRGPGARRYTCCAVKTLEQFRHVVGQHLRSGTKLRQMVLAAAADEAATATAEKAAGPGSRCGSKAAAGDPDGVEAQISLRSPRPEEQEQDSPKHMTPSRLARKVRQRRRRGPIVPPRFFVGSGSNCGLAFAHAREGRNAVSRETLVGVIHFEGRLCEELMRLSSDGIIRCFTPYDCERPRIRLRPVDLLHVQPMEGLFLGRFHLWQVQTIHRVFVFCSSDANDRTEWVQAVHDVMKASKAPVSETKPPLPLVPLKNEQTLAPQDAPPDPSPAASDTHKAHSMADRLHGGALMSKVNSTLHSTLHLVSMKYALREPGLGDLAAMLTDNTRARRWRQTRRLVLNDRLLLADGTSPPPPSIGATLLETALQLQESPATSDIIAFTNLTCKLKAVRFRGWNQNELLAFWLNVYHCLLLHGWLLFGRPGSASELKRFHVRVSYLVGLRPVSLREIERAILRIPQVEGPQGAVRAKAAGRARQLLGFCGLCRKRNPTGGSGVSRSPSGEEKTLSPSSTQGSLASVAVKGQCLPMPKLPNPQTWLRSFSGHHACLYLGNEPETFVLPKQDLRCILVLNRGNHNCLAGIHVFHENRLSSELNNAARMFAAEFVRVQQADRDGRPMRVSVPESCKPLVKELSPDAYTVLKWLWDFVPSHVTPPMPSTKLKFAKGNEEPRDRSQLQKLKYSDPNLESETFEGLPQVGAELDAIVGTAQALATLTSSVRLDDGAPGDVVINVSAPVDDMKAGVMDAHFKDGNIIRL